MKKFLDKLEKVIPTVLGVMWGIIITFGSIGLAVYVVRWVLRLLGVL